MKTNKSVKSRFKVTAKGKLVRTKPGKRHLLIKKASKRKRRLKKKTLVSSSHARTYNKMMRI